MPPARGSDHPKALLTDEEARELYHLYWDRSLTMRELAERFGIHKSTAADIIHKRNWAWLWEEEEQA